LHANLDKTGGALKNGQSRDTGNIGHMTQIENKRKTQHSKVKRRWIQKPRATPGAREGWVVPVSYYVHAVLLIYSGRKKL
jgi:hypothetical protein